MAVGNCGEIVEALTDQVICIGATHVSYGVRTHAHLRAVDLKSTPLTTRAN